jgi:hypothetical protein
MELTGESCNIFRFNVNQELVHQINMDNETKYTLAEMEKAADKCFAHDWLIHTAAGSPYSLLSVTQKGVGVAQSKRQAEEIKLSRSPLKKISDFIEEHKNGKATNIDRANMFVL